MPFEIDNEGKKRFRRGASEISRHYKCPVEGCNKSYGLEGTMNQHIKLKHKDYYKKITRAMTNNIFHIEQQAPSPSIRHLDITFCNSQIVE